MTKKLFVTLRNHEGDKSYKTGDYREATASVVKHLIPKVLREATKEEIEEFKKGSLSVGAKPPEDKAPAPEAKKLIDIKGVGEGTAKKLVEAGIDTVDTLAGLTSERVEELSGQLNLDMAALVASATELLASEEEE